ncbi:MAG: formylglycine-generating enzyme family protein [Oscillatoriales cyanobacterium RM2_1_1]|nr:formylglycine-generating enzyme family protein [Oscillatoriales cyanobacterium SM2_3_0]NJO45106.1 formylglycine-generating enzyme family protein [Oscillatoriales cyanobacterium RM2_1_1]
MKSYTLVLKLLISYLAITICWVNTMAFAAPTRPNPELAKVCPVGMAYIPGGSFTMGSGSAEFTEEGIVKDVTVSSFCIDQHEMTNGEFAQFIAATGYKTVAERPLSPEQFPDLAEDERAAGSVVFQPPEEGIQQIAYMSWWHWVPGANWQHPFGPESSIADKDNHPVVHIAYEDALAYAEWVGKQLPTEAQWEYAARGGSEQSTELNGEDYSPKKANTWQGMFPFFNTKADGYLGTAPVASFPPNDYGLYDMTGNVWEWTADWYRVGRQGMAHSKNPQGPDQAVSFDPKKPVEGASHVIKGGSHLCAKNYCSRYRPEARESQTPDTGTTHIGFRLAKDLV